MEDLTEYDVQPREFRNYLKYYGKHINQKLCEYICEELFDHYYTLDDMRLFYPEGKHDYDRLYLYNYYRNLFYGSGIDDDQHLIKIIDTAIDKEHDLIFNRVLADTARRGIVIYWEDFI